MISGRFSGRAARALPQLLPSVAPATEAPINLRDDQSRPRIKKFDRCSLEVPYIAGRQYVVVLYRNCTNRRIRKIYGITRPICGSNNLCVSLRGALAKRENTICEQRYQLLVDHLP